MHKLAQGFPTASTAMAVSDSTPGLWSARKMKRNAAVQRDMTLILNRLEKFDAMLVQTDSKVDKLMNAVDIEVCSHRVGHDLDEEVHDVQSRISRIELLLFRTSVEELKDIDDKIALIMPTAA